MGCSEVLNLEVVRFMSLLVKQASMRALGSVAYAAEIPGGHGYYQLRRTAAEAQEEPPHRMLSGPEAQGPGCQKDSDLQRSKKASGSHPGMPRCKELLLNMLCGWSSPL